MGITIIIKKHKYKFDYTRDIVININSQLVSQYKNKRNVSIRSKEKIQKDWDRQDKIGKIKLTKKHVDIVIKVNIKIDNINKYKQYSWIIQVIFKC